MRTSRCRPFFFFFFSFSPSLPFEREHFPGTKLRTFLTAALVSVCSPFFGDSSKALVGHEFHFSCRRPFFLFCFFFGLVVFMLQVFIYSAVNQGEFDVKGHACWRYFHRSRGGHGKMIPA